MQAYRTESGLLERPEDLRQEWLELQERTDCSFFLSWGLDRHLAATDRNRFASCDGKGMA